jgi:hypothetical protein
MSIMSERHRHTLTRTHRQDTSIVMQSEVKPQQIETGGRKSIIQYVRHRVDDDDSSDEKPPKINSVILNLLHAGSLSSALAHGREIFYNELLP